VDTARQQDMPLSAIASGHIDLILSIEDIAREIVRIARTAHRGEVVPSGF
jgi:two-component system chemotaxis response regulator CheB